MSLNWEKTSGTNEGFAESYCENISKQYSKQFKRSPYEMEIIETIDFYGGKAAFVVSEYSSSSSWAFSSWTGAFSGIIISEFSASTS